MAFARGKFYLWNFKIWIRFTVHNHHHHCRLLLGSLSSAGLGGGQRIEIHGTCLNSSSIRDNKSSCLYFSGIFKENGFCFPCFCLAYRVITTDKYGQGDSWWTCCYLLSPPGWPELCTVLPELPSQYLH